jgi:hypothetical protein
MSKIAYNKWITTHNKVINTIKNRIISFIESYNTAYDDEIDVNIMFDQFEEQLKLFLYKTSYNAQKSYTS